LYGSITCSNKALTVFSTILVQRDKVHASFSLFFHHALLNEPQSAALAGCRVILTWGAKEKKGGGATIASHTSAKLIKPAAARASTAQI
jgi:hypothetical protein